MPDLTGMGHAVDDLTKETIPAALAGLNALVDRLEKLIERLDGASFVLVLPSKGDSNELH